MSSAFPPPIPPTPPLAPGPVARHVEYTPGEPMPFTLGDVFSEAWSLMFRRYWLYVGSFALYWISILVLGFIPGIGGFITWFLGPVDAAVRLIPVRVARSQETSIQDLFKVFGPKYWMLFVIQLLFSIAISIVFIPAIAGLVVVALCIAEVIPNGVAWGIIAGVVAIIGMIAGSWFYARLVFAPMLYLDVPPNSL